MRLRIELSDADTKEVLEIFEIEKATMENLKLINQSITGHLHLVPKKETKNV